ncbi:hypothetical protein GCM10010329_61460 [Streptomyces spiroverticillatus]|uniref:Uncharacterized protein n=1 Tax=Streptomyces finlayi TaxID=67296 RepID=A0A919CED2_9ACTN|nr:hypothetical protein GCM10010329_61460 [Streptomyces spiroverticillatus]GHD15159.1 hypothetical protein GCM10010334_74990 [Streptomyces finlayi]
MPHARSGMRWARACLLLESGCARRARAMVRRIVRVSVTAAVKGLSVGWCGVLDAEVPRGPPRRSLGGPRGLCGGSGFQDVTFQVRVPDQVAEP